MQATYSLLCSQEKTCSSIFILFIYSLFNKAFTVSDFVASSDLIIDEFLIVKDVEGSSRRVI
jgi:hypothetical protein